MAVFFFARADMGQSVQLAGSDVALPTPSPYKFPMTVVGLDYLPAVAHAPGVGRYARELVRALAPLEDRPELRLLDMGGGERVMTEPSLGLEGASRLRRRSSRLPRRAARFLGRVGLGADRLLGGVDLFHRILPEQPLVSRAPEVQPVAELPPPGSAADVVLGTACRRARAVVVFSEAYRLAVRERYDLDPASVHRTPVGCEHWRRQIEAPEPAPAHLLVLGAIRKARQSLRVLAGFEALLASGKEARLTFVGHPGDGAPEFERALWASAARDQIEWVSAPREADMPATMASARTLVHLADDEGSPVTPLEAFSFGRSVVGSRLATFEEALADQAHYVGPEATSEEIAAQMANALDDDREDERLAIARSYTWQACARETVSVWRSLL